MQARPIGSGLLAGFSSNARLNTSQLMGILGVESRYLRRERHDL